MGTRRKVTIRVKDQDEEREDDGKMDDLIMWHRIGHFLRYLGALLLLIGFAVFLMALAVHAGHLPTYTNTLLIIVAVVGVAGIIGGNLTIANVYTDPEWTGENDENKRRHK